MPILVQSQYATVDNFTECEWAKIESALALQRRLAYVTWPNIMVSQQSDKKAIDILDQNQPNSGLVFRFFH